MRAKLNKLIRIPGHMLTIVIVSGCVYYAVYKHLRNINVSEPCS